MIKQQPTDGDSTDTTTEANAVGYIVRSDSIRDSNCTNCHDEGLDRYCWVDRSDWISLSQLQGSGWYDDMIIVNP